MARTAATLPKLLSLCLHFTNPAFAMKCMYFLSFLLIAFLYLSISSAQPADVVAQAGSVPDSLLILADGQEERKLLSDIFEQVAKLPKEKQQIGGV